MNIFFTSDQHFGHDNIIRFCNRPFSSTWNMDEVIISRYNERVGPDDWVFMLGDFAYKNKNQPSYYFNQLNGKKVLIKGNHDKRPVLSLGWESIHDVLHMRTQTIPGYRGPKREIFLSHYPHRSWNKSAHGIGHLFGHAHGKLDPWMKSFDAGVDCHDFCPLSIEEAFDIFRTLGEDQKCERTTTNSPRTRPGG